MPNKLMDLFIRKESRHSDFVVSLWFVLANSGKQEVCYAPPKSWLEYSQRIEAAAFLNDSTLGQIDACLARGSSVHVRLPMFPGIFKTIPITPVQSSPRLRHIVKLA